MTTNDFIARTTTVVLALILLAVVAAMLKGLFDGDIILCVPSRKG